MINFNGCSMKLLKSLFLGLLFSPLFAGIQQNPGSDTTKELQSVDLEAISLEDDPYVAQLDSLLRFTFFKDAQQVESTREFLPSLSPDSALALVPEFNDSVFASRLARLDENTPFSLDFNIYVKRYIDVYSKHRREQVSRMMGLAHYYFPMFEEALDRHGLPLELKYLAIVESALNPLARSRVGATGLWQFMYSTGRMQGLSVSSYVDERSDPLASTEAACLYLKKLYGIFGDWNLALAAYNSGPGNVNKAIRRSGGQRNYWDIRPFLPRETAGYVPAFIAVNYIMNYGEEHFLFPTEIKPSYFETDTVWIKEKISFEQISKLIDVSEDDLHFLNPAFRYKIIPKKSGEPYALTLPAEKIGAFINNEDSIYTLAQKDFERQEKQQPTYVEMDERIRHVVQRGEVLGLIAERYGVSVSSIRRWNGLRGNTIRVGQRLTIYPRKLPANPSQVASASSSTTVKKTANGEYVAYRVRQGETFYSIARKYPGVSAQNIMSWNKIADARELRPGMTLKIYPNS